MWLFLRRRLIMWLVLAIAVPLLEYLLGKIGDELRARKGDSGLTRGIDRVRSGLRTIRGKRP
jgi:hypothetical protein